MSNVRQKPAAALAFKRGGRGVVPILPQPPVNIPEAPEDVGDYALAVWESFWQSEVSGAVNMKRDGERLRHWCRCVDQRERLWKLWRNQPLMTGMKGGLVGNPLWRQIKDLTADIDRAEQVFGMTPLYKMRLTGALDQAEAAESSIKARRDRRPVEA
jgi:P27 family predicted phage terminase small subunit